MWTLLVIVVWWNAGMTSIPGYHSKEECMAAGEEVNEQNHKTGDSYIFRTRCVRQPKSPDELTTEIDQQILKLQDQIKTLQAQKAK